MVYAVGEKHEILFPEDTYAEGYTVYATNYPSMRQTGDVQEALSTLFTGYASKSWSFVPEDIREDPAACASGMGEEEVPYRCSGQLHYAFRAFPGQELAVTVTTARNGQESPVAAWAVTSK